MAMKFWFGKKEPAASAADKVSCDVLAVSNPADEEKVPVSPLFGVTQTGDSAIESADESKQPVFQQVPDPTCGETGEAEKNEGEGQSVPADSSEEGKQDVKPSLEKRDAPVPGPTIKAILPEDKAVASDSGAKPLLRPLGASVRLTVPGPGFDAAKKAGADHAVEGVVTAVPHVVGGEGAKPAAFGFRLKAKTSVVSSAAAASSVPTPAPSVRQVPSADKRAEDKTEKNAGSDLSLVRPKVDQRALYYELMNGLYDAVLILDDQGHVVDSNTRVTSVLGYAREEMWDMPINKVITGMTSQMFEHLRRNLAESHHVLIDARCFRQDGTAFAGEVGVSQLSLTRGGNMVFVIRNVDRRKTAMEELRKGQAAMSVSLSPTFVCDLDGFFQIVNQALLEAFGIPDEKQAKSVRFVDLLPDAARFFLRASCGEKLRETMSITTPEGGSVNVELALSPIQNGQTVTAVAGSILQQ